MKNLKQYKAEISLPYGNKINVKYIYTNPQKDEFEKSSENNVLDMGLTYSKSSGNMSSNIEKEKKNDYSDPETV